jgi:hypothetical protein
MLKQWVRLEFEAETCLSIANISRLSQMAKKVRAVCQTEGGNTIHD